ncbi:MAG: hypothetical protein KGJ84_16075 [Elusimicrobia bacterium]|nr:hypothetical protein [Elusimicrobiota bacterium]
MTRRAVSADRSSSPPRWLFPALIAVATALAFRTALSARFLTWDDLDNFVLNDNYRGLGWTNLKWMFTAIHMGVYIPLTWLSCAFDYELWGMNAAGYHLTNLVLHALNAVLVFRIAAALYDGEFAAERSWLTDFSAAGAALLFALHPLRVESVAWVTERRDVLSGFFFLAAVRFHLQGRRKAAVGAFGFSLLSKATGVSLPALLLVLDFYRAPRMDRRAWVATLREKIPFLLLSVPFAVVALLGQAEKGAAKSWSAFGLTERLAVSSRSALFYLYRTAWPFHLSPLYRLPPFEKLNLWPFPAYVVLTALATVLAVLRARKQPALASAWFWYLLALFPLSGFFQSGGQLAADRYSYIPCLSWAVFAGGLLREIFRRRTDVRLRVGAGAALVVLIAGLGFLADRQTRVWRDSVSFWSYVVSEDPGSPAARNNLGATLAQRGDLKDAVKEFRETLRLDPGREDARLNLVKALGLLNSRNR